MMLAASSSFKGKSDMAKYDKAMKLKGFIGKIREDYTKKLSSGDKRTKQVCFLGFLPVLEGDFFLFCDIVRARTKKLSSGDKRTKQVCLFVCLGFLNVLEGDFVVLCVACTVGVLFWGLEDVFFGIRACTAHFDASLMREESAEIFSR